MKSLTSQMTIATTLLALSLSAYGGAGVTTVYQTSADELWSIVDFHQPSENIMPPIESSALTGKGVGATKINSLNGGGEVHLQLVYYSPDDRAFNYVIRTSPLPVNNYVGEVRVEALGENKAQLSWQGIYDANGVAPEEADKILQGFYDAIVGKIGESFPIE